jgi:hypothetical protein
MMFALALALLPLAQQTPPPDPPPATPAKDGGDPAPPKAPDPEAQARAKAKAALLDRTLDQLDVNEVLATANGEVVTVRDVYLQWKLDGRIATDPDRATFPNPEDARNITKSIVTARLWRAHARLFPSYAEIATASVIEDYAKEHFGPVLSDPTLTADEKSMIRETAEELLAEELVLNTDPEFRRARVTRPDDVKRYWDDHPEIHSSPPLATLGRVLLGRELYGAKVEDLAQEIRRKAQELGSLEAAARELAPGSYSEPKELRDIALTGKNQGLRDEILEIAKNGQRGDLSAPIVGRNSVMIVTLLDRKDAVEHTFEEMGPKIRVLIQNVRMERRALEYFVTKILRDAFYRPDDLFREEFERVFSTGEAPPAPAGAPAKAEGSKQP